MRGIFSEPIWWGSELQNLEVAWKSWSACVSSVKARNWSVMNSQVVPPPGFCLLECLSIPFHVVRQLGYWKSSCPLFLLYHFLFKVRFERTSLEALTCRGPSLIGIPGWLPLRLWLRALVGLLSGSNAIDDQSEVIPHLGFLNLFNLTSGSLVPLICRPHISCTDSVALTRILLSFLRRFQTVSSDDRCRAWAIMRLSGVTARDLSRRRVFRWHFLVLDFHLRFLRFLLLMSSVCQDPPEKTQSKVNSLRSGWSLRGTWVLEHWQC